MAWNPFTRRKDNPVAGATLSYYGGRPVYNTTGATAFARAYTQNPDIYAAVEIMATACAGVAWYGEVKKRGVWQRVDDHPALELWQQPNPKLGNTNFIGNLVRWQCIAGEFYVARNEAPKGPPRELWVLQPMRMTITPGKTYAEEVAAYEYKIGGNKQIIPPELVWHLPLFHPLSDHYGLSPIGAAARMVDQAQAAADYNLGLLQNGGIPPGFLKTQDTLDDPQFAKLKEEMQTNWAAAKNAGLPQLLEGGMEFQAVGTPPKDMQMLEAQRMHALKFAQVIGLPPEFLAGAGEKKYSNYAEAHKALYTVGALPKLDAISDSVNPWLAQWFPDFRLCVDVADIEALKEDVNNLWQRVNTSAHLTINEKRELTGQETVPDGDVILIPFSVAPLAQVVAEPAPLEPTPEPDEEPPVEGATKALNVPDDAKAAYWKLVDAQRRRLESSVEAMARKRLAADNRAIVAAIRSAPTPPAAVKRMERAVEAQDAAWKAWYEDVWLKVGEPFAEETLRELKASAAPDRVKAGKDGWAKRVLGYLAKHGTDRIVGVMQTTKDEIGRELAAGIEAGESIPALAKRVDSFQLEQLIPRRSRAIARTEVVAASNAASLAAAESTELPLEKEWIETADDRTRESHKGIDAVPMGDAFTLGSGAEVEFPGDWSHGADAGDLVNCRCTQAYRVVE